jgi:hypothetical protein
MKASLFAGMFISVALAASPALADPCLRLAGQIERFGEELSAYADRVDGLPPARICADVRRFKIRLDGYRTQVLRREKSCSFPPVVREQLTVARGFLNEIPCN